MNLGKLDWIEVKTSRRGTFHAMLLPGRGYSVWAGFEAKPGHWLLTESHEHVVAGQPIELRASAWTPSRVRVRIQGVEKWRHECVARNDAAPEARIVGQLQVEIGSAGGTTATASLENLWAHRTADRGARLETFERFVRVTVESSDRFARADTSKIDLDAVIPVIKPREYVDEMRSRAGDDAPWVKRSSRISGSCTQSTARGQSATRHVRTSKHSA